MSKNKDDIFEASKIACDTWNQRCPKHPVAIGVMSYRLEGRTIVVDGILNFYRQDQILNGEFQVGNYSTSWDDPMELVFGWMECIEESFHHVFEE